MLTPDPKGFTFNPIFEPNKERMLKGLRLILEAPKRRNEEPAQTAVKADGDPGGVA